MAGARQKRAGIAEGNAVNETCCRRIQYGFVERFCDSRGFEMTRLVAVFMSFFLLLGCGEAVEKGGEARILMMGDSLLAWNQTSGSSVSHVLEDLTKQEIIDRSVVGARIFYPLPVSGALGLSIPAQYREGPWDWVILNGGGNDLWMSCGCSRCDALISRMISEDGTSGKLVEMAQDYMKRGAKVLFVGYLHSPGFSGGFENCADDGAAFEARVANFSKKNKGFFYVPLHDLVPHGDESFHDSDKVHPSRKGSAHIAARIAPVLQKYSN